jgi:hypothetical protein
MLKAGFLYGLLYNPEDGGDMFLHDVGWLPMDYHDVIPQNIEMFNVEEICRSLM